MFTNLQLPSDVLDVLAEHVQVLRRYGQLQEALDVAARAIESSRTAVRRLEGGWGDVVAASRASSWIARSPARQRVSSYC